MENKTCAIEKTNSVIEDKLAWLRGRIDATLFVTADIISKLWDAVPPQDEAKSARPITVAEHLDKAITDLTIANEQLSRIADCLQGQLGSLKLEN